MQMQMVNSATQRDASSAAHPQSPQRTGKADDEQTSKTHGLSMVPTKEVPQIVSQEVPRPTVTRPSVALR